MSQDDLPRIDIYNFERVQIAPVDGELKSKKHLCFLKVWLMKLA